MNARTHTRIAEWYGQLGQSLEAGISLVEALRLLQPPVKGIDSWADLLESGRDFDGVIETASKQLPQTDLLLLSAGKETGRLVQVMERLSRMHAEAAEARRTTFAALLYPGFLLHIMLLAFPLYPIGQAQKLGAVLLYPEDFFLSAGLSILSLWGVLLLLSFLEILWKPVAGRLPGLRGYLHDGARARFAESLEGFLIAGVSMEKAWAGASLCSQNRILEKQALSLLPEIRLGRNPGAYLDTITFLPSSFRQLYRTGESTGKLPENLEKLAQVHRQKSLAALKSATFWYPKLLFLLIAVLVSIALVRGFSEYLDQLNF